MKGHKNPGGVLPFTGYIAIGTVCVDLKFVVLTILVSHRICFSLWLGIGYFLYKERMFLRTNICIFVIYSNRRHQSD